MDCMLNDLYVQLAFGNIFPKMSSLPEHRKLPNQVPLKSTSDNNNQLLERAAMVQLSLNSIISLVC